MPTFKHIARAALARPTYLSTSHGPQVLVRGASDVVYALGPSGAAALPHPLRAVPRAVPRPAGGALLVGWTTDGRTVVSELASGEAPATDRAAWSDLDGRAHHAPACAVSASGGALIAVRGLDGGLWIRTQESPAASWSPWLSLGGQLQGAPVAVSLADGAWLIAALGTDRAVWHRRYDGGWRDWATLEGALTSDIAAVALPGGDALIAGRGGDGAVWLRTLTRSWWSIAGAVVGAPALQVAATGEAFVAAIGLDHAIWTCRHDAPDAWRPIPGRCRVAVGTTTRADSSPGWVAALESGDVVVASLDGAEVETLPGDAPAAPIEDAAWPEPVREAARRAERAMASAVIRAAAHLEAPSELSLASPQERAIAEQLEALPALRAALVPRVARAALAQLAGPMSVRDMRSVAAQIPAAWRLPDVAPPPPPGADGIGTAQQAIEATDHFVELAITRIYCHDESDPEQSADDLFLAALAVMPDKRVVTRDPVPVGDYDTGTDLSAGAFKESGSRATGRYEFRVFGKDLARAAIPFSLTLWDDDTIPEGWVFLAKLLHEVGLLAVYGTVYYYTESKELAAFATALADRIGRWVGEKIAAASDSDFLGTATAVWRYGAPPTSLHVYSAEHKSHYEVFVAFTSNVPMPEFIFPVVPNSITFVPYLDGRFASLAAHPDSTDGVLVVDASGQIWRGAAPHTSWTRVAGSARRVAAAGPGRVLFLDAAGQLMQSDGTTVRRFGMLRDPVPLRHIAEGADGEIWGVTLDGRAARYVRRRVLRPGAQQMFDEWRFDMPAELVAAGSSEHVWALHKSGAAYAREPGGFAARSQSPVLSWITTAKDGVAYGLDPAGNFYGWSATKGEWEKYECNVQLREIGSASYDLVWGLDFQGRIHVSRTRSRPPL